MLPGQLQILVPAFVRIINLTTEGVFFMVTVPAVIMRSARPGPMG
uniref:ORF44f n=1 Tax=Pinus koraiensis TaxID=88728 RepID=A4QM66_PINKO|nr:ORF44f [Pinus koraiensis]ABP35404.1 ORF44f [Pinus koraiensis]